MNRVTLRALVCLSPVALAGLSTHGPAALHAQQSEAEQRVAELAGRYEKSEHRVEMRDGTSLYLALYEPRERRAEELPILLTRTPYSCNPYGPEQMPPRIGPNRLLEDEGYIFACQDVRGRFQSEGTYDNMRPHVPGELPIDESSDTWDTIEWLVQNVPSNNGRVGMWGISYPGFYAAAALPEAHSALVASSPQAPIADFFFDDFHHHGAYTLAYWFITPVFGYQQDSLNTGNWFRFPTRTSRDGYKFYMDLGPLENSDAVYDSTNFFWQQLVEHPNYDEFWQARNILPHLHGVDHAVLTVGGWYDAEDLYGPLNIYRTLERENPDIAYNGLVMGPWGHGDWARTLSPHVIGDIEYGDDISGWYQREVEAPFFRYWLNGAGAPPEFDALTFDTGSKEWRAFPAWPPVEADTRTLYLRDDEVLSWQAPSAGEGEFTEYVSDPNEPVPYTDDIRFVFTPRRYMNEDQRFAERRPDVIEFQTEPLEEELTLGGDVLVRLQVSTTGTDSDWIVKLIDVYPDDTPNGEHTPEGVVLGGYQQMVRSEIFRGRFRDSYEFPTAFVPGERTVVEFPLQDLLHTFKPGHRIMVQVQSSWFPLFDRNPQTFVPNIFEAEEKHFVKATQRVWHTPAAASRLEVKVLPPGSGLKMGSD
ncbi:MAG: CocE/NonD family hydrolase [marine benthic group bacterium]|jgi:putative CocE/NonD family hydrolase|nr:CocE/NonD family hydrolase [Gemmatimonadota bacterium]